MEIANVKKIIRKWPAYKKYIENIGINPGKIKTLNELPIIDKEFIASAIHTVPIFKIRNIVPSSGSTDNNFSFGLFGDGELKRTSQTIDTIIKSHFNTQNKKTLLLNMLPGAIALQSSTASIASIGVRTDTAISAIKAFSSSFDQLILVGEPLFIKSLIELGLQESILWKHIPLLVIVGGEWTPESYGNYLETMTGPQRVYSSMGMAELGLNYFYETEKTIMVRHHLSEDQDLLRMLFGDLNFCPMIFSYDINEIYVESIYESDSTFGSLILTTLDPNRALPLIRYKGGDKGKILSRDEINHALKTRGYAPLFSTPGPPVLAHYGRGKRIADIYPEKIKDIIFNNWEVVSTATGNFKLSEKNSILQLQIQLKEGIQPTFSLDNEYRKTFSILPVQVKLYSFERFPFYLDFERKVRYVCENNNSGKDRREKVGVPTTV